MQCRTTFKRKVFLIPFGQAHSRTTRTDTFECAWEQISIYFKFYFFFLVKVTCNVHNCLTKMSGTYSQTMLMKNVVDKFIETQ